MPLALEYNVTKGVRFHLQIFASKGRGTGMKVHFGFPHLCPHHLTPLCLAGYRHLATSYRIDCPLISHQTSSRNWIVARERVTHGEIVKLIHMITGDRQ